MAKANLDEYKGFLREELTPAQNRDFYICPLCGSGTGPHKTAALRITPDGKHWTCFSCSEGGDIFDLFAKRDGLTAAEAIKAVQAKYSTGGGFAPRPAPAKPATSSFDAAAYIEQCSARIADSDGERYFTKRGLSPETIRRFRLGFDPNCYVAALKTRTPAVIIPYGQDSKYYAIRAIKEKAFGKPPRDAVGPEPVFNASALYRDSSPVFVVESQICALSIEQAGGKAVALGGTSGGNRLMQQLGDHRPTASTFILCLDNDDAGRSASAKLGELLTSAGYEFIPSKNLVYDGCKDPNDILQKIGPEHFAARVKMDIDAANAPQAEEIDRTAEEYANASAAGYIDAFKGMISESVNTSAIPTGYAPIDAALDGGLYEGLYILGAISSLGKTTFALQMIDQIARAGYDSMVFSLEMARYELMARSISRLTYQIAMRENIDKRNAKTTRGITNGSKWRSYSDTELYLIEKAIDDYQENVAPRVWIHEGIGDIGVTQIRAAVARHITITGRRPVVLIDYLQILAPHNEKMTDKQNIDKAVLELKRMSRDFKIPIVAISSLNRDNYTAPIKLAAFKESGAIEYSADVLIGMQYTGMDYYEGETDKARETRIRELLKGNERAGKEGKAIDIDVKLLKNRNGGRAPIDPIAYIPMFNAFSDGKSGFVEVDAADALNALNPQPRRRR